MRSAAVTANAPCGGDECDRGELEAPSQRGGEPSTPSTTSPTSSGASTCRGRDRPSMKVLAVLADPEQQEAAEAAPEHELADVVEATGAQRELDARSPLTIDSPPRTST